MNKLAPIILFGLLLAGCAERYEYHDVQGVIVDLDYDAAKSSYKSVTNYDGEIVKKLVYEPEEYEVTIRYDDITKEFEFSDDTFYNLVKVGDTVNLELTIGFDAEGNIVTKNIDLYDDISASLQ